MVVLAMVLVLVTSAFVIQDIQALTAVASLARSMKVKYAMDMGHAHAMAYVTAPQKGILGMLARLNVSLMRVACAMAMDYRALDVMASQTREKSWMPAVDVMVIIRHVSAVMAFPIRKCRWIGVVSVAETGKVATWN